MMTSPEPHYPIPRVEDLFAKLSGEEQFSELNMSHAYLQVMLEEGFKQYVTINTQQGLYTFNHLPFGVSSTPALFQRIMEGSSEVFFTAVCFWMISY